MLWLGVMGVVIILIMWYVVGELLWVRVMVLFMLWVELIVMVILLVVVGLCFFVSVNLVSVVVG